MKVLVTGNSGFVGGSFGRAAAAAGHDIIGLSRGEHAPDGWQGVHLRSNVAVDDLSEIIDEFTPDVLFHAAGGASVGASITAPHEDLVASLHTWANTLDSIRRARFKPRIIYPSSAAVYGNVDHLPVSENAPVQPISPYGFHKAACELLANEYSSCFGLDIIVCRFFSLFGPAQRRLLVRELYQQFSGGDNKVRLQGTGTETRDYLHIDDAAEAVLKLCDISSPSGHSRIVNIASGTETNVLELAGQIGALLRSPKEVVCAGLERKGDPRAWRADISLLSTLIPDWWPQSFPEALGRCVSEWAEESD